MHVCVNDCGLYWAGDGSKGSKAMTERLHWMSTMGGPLRDRASQVMLAVKNPPANAGDLRDVGSASGWGRSPGEKHGNPFSILAWRIPWTEETGRLQSTGSQRVELNWSNWARTHSGDSLYQVPIIPAPPTVRAQKNLEWNQVEPILTKQMQLGRANSI